ncbi:MAG: hypothetical protein ACTHM4_01455, partial [Rhodanobacteraceae bacterium]
AAALVAGAVGLVAVLYYEAHPQLLHEQLGTLGVGLLGIVVGGYLVFSAITSVRGGISHANFIGGEYKRSVNAPMFWFVVVFDFAFGGFMLVAGLGLLLGLFHA